MNAEPELVYINCSQPKQFGMLLQFAVVVLKKFEFSCSEKVLATCGPVPPTCPASVVTPLTLSKEPTALDMWPVTWATTSLPLPTVSGRAPAAGGYGRTGAFVQGISCHSVFGYAAVKQPCFGTGTFAIDARQASRCAAVGCTTTAAVPPSLAAGVSGSAAVARLDDSAHSRLAAAMMLRTIVTRPRAELDDFMGCPPTNG